ncbi:hypothetical protein NDN08_004686 [Rhodosorus marinus]|uniref:Uncharacterized protein n=1 Tax=Rhodosorus marinus TaxID=101924 RepID=A0AAV8UR09_9RHOD|nr:hypothetical protein NDN08_004686 [Rhodosorus marinus]
MAFVMFRRWIKFQDKELSAWWKDHSSRWMVFLFISILICSLAVEGEGVTVGLERLKLAVKRDEILVKCENLFVDVGVRSGEGLLDFVDEGGITASWMSSISADPRSFCVEAFEADERFRQELEETGRWIRNKLQNLDVRVGAILSNSRGTTRLTLTSQTVAEYTVSNISGHVVYNAEQVASINQNREASRRSLIVEDLRDVLSRNRLAEGGFIAIRFQCSCEDAVSYLRMLINDSKLCFSVDKVFLQVIDTQTLLVREGQSSTHSDLTSELEDLAQLMHRSSGCDVDVEIEYEMITPQNEVQGDHDVVYAVLSGDTTLNERGCWAASTWMKGVPRGRAAFFTNDQLDPKSEFAECLNGHVAVVAKPAFPDIEKLPDNMQSWSHLVRVRMSWDLLMKNDPSAKYLILIDDDTFPFTDTIGSELPQHLSWDKMRWGGALEVVRVDNGDDTSFKEQLRRMHRADGKDCRFEEEPEVEGLAACNKTFCFACPSIPQGGFVVMSRALVEAVRPHVEECEFETQGFCKQCGSQRLYYCLLNRVNATRAVALRGVFRLPWMYEAHQAPAQKVNYPLSFHGLKESAYDLHTGSGAMDFQELYRMVKQARRRAAVKAGDEYVTLDDVNFHISCDGKGYFHNESCYATFRQDRNKCKLGDFTSWVPEWPEQNVYS